MQVQVIVTPLVIEVIYPISKTKETGINSKLYKVQSVLDIVWNDALHLKLNLLEALNCKFFDIQLPVKIHH